jgi:hypothetical protein
MSHDCYVSHADLYGAFIVVRKMRNPADSLERGVYAVNRIASRYLSLLCLCSLLLTGCHSLFSGDTTVLLPEQEKLLPAVKYAYDNPLTTDKYASDQQNAFKIDDEAIGDILSFECLDYLEDTGEFVYFYQSVLKDDNYRAAYATYEEELEIFSIDPESEYYKTNHLPLYQAIQAAYDTINAEYVKMKNRYNARRNKIGGITPTNYESYRVAYITQLASYETLLEAYIDNYWPDTFESVITEEDRASYNGTYQQSPMPMKPLKPEPQPPEPPGASVSELMITHMAAYNYETEEIRDFFVQETGPNAEQTAFAYKIPDSDNYTLYFGGQAYFYLPDGTCYLQVNFRPQLERVVDALEEAYTVEAITVTDVTPFSGGSELYMYLMVETEQIDENTEVSQVDLEDYRLPQESVFYVSIRCSLVASDFCFNYDYERDPARLTLQGGDLYHEYFGTMLNEIDDALHETYSMMQGLGVSRYSASERAEASKRYERLLALQDNVRAAYNTINDLPVYWDDPSSEIQLSDLDVGDSLLNMALTAPTGADLLYPETLSISLGGFIGTYEPLMKNYNTWADPDLRQVGYIIPPIENTAYLATFTTHVSGSQSLGATPLSGGGRVINNNNSILWEGTQGYPLTKEEAYTFTNAEGRDQSDTVLSVGNLPLWENSGLENSFAVFTSKKIYIYFYNRGNQYAETDNRGRTQVGGDTPDAWHRVTLPLEHLYVNTSHIEESYDTYGILNSESYEYDMQDYFGSSGSDTQISYEETNPDRYDIRNVLAITENDFIISTLHNGVVRVYIPENDTTFRVVQLHQVPVFQTWRLSDGSFLAVGFDTLGKQYTATDFPKARVLYFEAEENLETYPSKPSSLG